jgi:prophage regulatory protein
MKKHKTLDENSRSDQDACRDGVAIVAGDRLLTIKEVGFKVSMGRSTIYRWITEGRFPPGIELSVGMVRWRESVIDAWIAAISSGDPAKAPTQEEGP